jgi:hypothetical protein
MTELRPQGTCYEPVAEEELVELAGEGGEEAAQRSGQASYQAGQPVGSPPAPGTRVRSIYIPPPPQ